MAVQDIHSYRHTRYYGSPRMAAELRQRGHTCSVNRVVRLVRSVGLRVRPRKPYRPKTTRPDHAACPSPNLLAAAMPLQVPGTHLVGDITYIPTCRLLDRLGRQQSMSTVGYCYDKDCPQSPFVWIKSELLTEDGIFESKSATYTAIFDYLECFYSRGCLHSASR